MGRFTAYFVLTALLTASVCSYAYYKKEQQFFPAAVWMATSKPCIMVLSHQLFVLLLGAGRLLKSFFLGRLRDEEVRHVFRNSRFLVAEFVIIIMIFKDEMNSRIVALFALLMGSKIFHWLCGARVAYVDQSQSEDTGAMGHLRVFMLMCTLLAVDVAMAAFAGYYTLKGGTSVRMVLGFEFVLLSIHVFSTFFRYLLHLVDYRLGSTWQSKALLGFTLQLGADCWSAAVGVAYLLAHFTFYGTPFHVIRLLWVTLSGARRRIGAYSKQRALTSALKHSLPDASAAAIAALTEADADCVICRDPLPVPPAADSALTAKVLPCGHIFHLCCLQRWMLRGKT
eukprot:g4321.t1